MAVYPDRLTRARWACALCALLGLAQPCLAQTVADVRGRILRASDANPIVEATVELLGTGRVDTTSASGAFMFRGVPQGSYKLSVRRLGYYPFADSIHVTPADTAARTFRIPELLVRLPRVTIMGRLVDVPQRFEEPYRRAARPWGHFFTREEIELVNPLDLGTLLNRIPGVKMNDREIVIQRCHAGPAKVQVWIDGYRLSGRGPNHPTQESFDLLRSVSPASVQIMEVYTSSVTIPAQFLDDACAVVAIWTKAR